jgi:hypothetical protein
MALPNLPLEIINIILSYRPRHPTAQLIKNEIDIPNCYNLDDYHFKFFLSRSFNTIDLLMKYNNRYSKKRLPFDTYFESCLKKTI